jgi:hypothetical protein
VAEKVLRLSVSKLNDVEVKEQYQVRNSNRFVTFEILDYDDDDDDDISRAW